MANQDSNNTEALQALLQSFGPDATQNVSSEALLALSDKLSELMGADVVRDAFAYKDQDIHMQEGSSEPLLNEEGLPIIDITEPIYPGQPLSQPTSDLITLEPPLVPLSALSPSERDLRRREQKRILDMLEAEEALEKHREREKEEQERREALDKRQEDGKTEREKLLALKETHKKMGKALLREVSKDAKKKSSPSLTDDQATSSTNKKKSVSFAQAEPSISSDSMSTQLEAAYWGDVSQGKLRPAAERPAPAFVKESERLMKLQVVERVPGGTVTNPGSAGSSTKKQLTKIQIAETGGDSDDESDVGSGSLSDNEAPLDDPDSDTEHSDVPDSEPEEGVDLDFAQHQREIALEYQRKRETIGRETAATLTSHTHEPEEDFLVPEVPSNKFKSSISQFRANRLASSYASSTSPSIIPAAAAQTIQRAIRLGKMDDQERLVGGEAGDSGSSEDETAREIIDLLQKGEVYNLGPNGEVIHLVPPNSTTTKSASSSQSAQLLPFTPPTEPLPQRSKTSRFKLAKQTERPKSNPAVSLDSSGLNTPMSNVGRSSPKLPSMVESVVERTAPASNPPAGHVSRSAAIIDSPSFPYNSNTSSRRPERPPTIMSSQVVESTRISSRPSQVEEEVPVKRVSRFKADRM